MGGELEGPPREACQQWMASPKLGPGRASGPEGGHRARREGAPGVGHVWQRCVNSSAEVGPSGSPWLPVFLA